MSAPEDEFKVWVESRPKGPGQMGMTGAVLKIGPRVCKTATLANYGDSETGEIRKRELRFRTAKKGSDTPGFDFDNADTWSCEGDEIERLVEFLKDEVQQTGTYRLINTSEPIAALRDLLASMPFDPQELATMLADYATLRPLIGALSSSQLGRTAAEGAVVAARREQVRLLQSMAANPDTTETHMQAELGEAYWLFGGRYIGLAERRAITAMDQFDIPLLESDGTLHIVELKGPVTPKLIYKYRSHFAVGKEVHEATSQAMNYLRSLDEQGLTLEATFRNDLGVNWDLRRVRATVVIGHPCHVPKVDERQIEQTIRTYNSHLTRIEVITYKQLLDAASQSLNFQDTALEEKLQ